jgi:hypothetical protein
VVHVLIGYRAVFCDVSAARYKTCKTSKTRDTNCGSLDTRCARAKLRSVRHTDLPRIKVLPFALQDSLVHFAVVRILPSLNTPAITVRSEGELGVSGVPDTQAVRIRQGREEGDWCGGRCGEEGEEGALDCEAAWMGASGELGF